MGDYETWKNNLWLESTILGGTAVFPRSRLAVEHVGGMLLNGVDKQEILEDYSYLSEQDLEFAKRFVVESECFDPGKIPLILEAMRNAPVVAESEEDEPETIIDLSPVPCARIPVKLAGCDEPDWHLEDDELQF